MNNAGVKTSGAYLAATLEEIEGLMALNVTAVSWIARVIGVRFAKEMRCEIIFIHSLTARPGPYSVLYLASKALCRLSPCLYERQEYAVDYLFLEPACRRDDLEMTPAEGAVGSCLTAQARAMLI